MLAEQAAARVPLPDELAGVDWLTPWAVALRYEEPTTALDRAAAVAAAERLAAGPRRCSMKARGTPRELGPQKTAEGPKTA